MQLKLDGKTLIMLLIGIIMSLTAYAFGGHEKKLDELSAEQKVLAETKADYDTIQKMLEGQQKFIELTTEELKSIKVDMDKLHPRTTAPSTGTRGE